MKEFFDIITLSVVVLVVVFTLGYAYGSYKGECVEQGTEQRALD